MKKFLISIFTISALLISACSNMSDGILESPVWNEADSSTVSAGDSNQNCITVTGSVGFSGAYPQELVNQDSSAASARTAFPSVSDLSNYDYDITATSESVTYTGTAAENGKTYQVTIPVTSTSTSYKVQIIAKTKDSTPKPVLEGVSESFSIGPESQTAIADVVLSASSKTTEKGGIKLTVTLGSDSGITSGILAIEGMDDIPGTLSGSTITFKTDNESKITCGAHKARFTFLNGSEASTSDEIYSFTQIVNVFQNLYTDAWIQNGAEPYFTTTTSGGKKTTTCQITKTMVDSYQLTEIYVDPTAADDNGSGTFIHPKKTFSGALAKLKNKDIDYTIYIKGTLTGAQTIPATLTNTASGTYRAKSLTLCGARGLNTSGEYQDILNGNNSGTVLTINTAVPVTIKNLNITGGNTTVNGGGINIGSGAEVSLVNSSVDGNTAAKYGGGIYNAGTVFLSGSTIIGKTGTELATTTSGNIAKESGAGIYNKGGKIYLGYTSSSSKATLTGGVCRNFLQNYTNSTALGGGIYNAGNIYFDTGSISYNFAYNGAGIYAYGNIEMTGGSIEGNEGSSGNDAGCGGGVFVGNEKSFTMSGDACIKNNKNMAHGAGVYLNYNNCKFIMNGGTISGNIAKTNGGAVYIHDMGANDSQHGHLQMKGASRIPYDSENKSNDIYMLDKNSAIEITGSLTGTSPVATITPNAYTSDTQVLKAESGVTLADEVGKFAVTKKAGDDKNWLINDSGKLYSIIGTKTGYALQDIVFNDGSTMPYSSNMTLTDFQKKNAIAVIGYKHNSNWLGVGLKEIEVRWADKDYSPVGYNSTGATDENNGSSNTDKIKKLSDYSSKGASCYPAFYWAINYSNSATNLGSYNTDWYIPSVNELSGILEHSTSTLVNIMKLLGSYANEFSTSDFYMSSTENAETKYKAESYSSSSIKDKDSKTKVRAIRIFY